MELTLKLLGGFAVRDGAERDLALRTRKTRALLAYLAVNADKPQPRERLMALLWSDRSEQQARQSLNQALVSIRHLADGEDAPLIESDGVQITLRGDALRSDVAQFRSAIPDDPAKAAGIYDGPFLDGMSAPDPAFEEWLRTTRSELQSLACGALGRAAEAAEDKGELADAITSARRQIALDPLNEDAHRRLMRLLHRSGDRASALRQYQSCAEILREELDVEPNSLTQALFAEIRQDGDTAKKETQTPASFNSPPPLPDKPSIAVLPFGDIGGDPSARLFAYGLTEDVITALSRVPDLTVISCSTLGIARDKALSDQDLTIKIGVDYVLQGSIRSHDDRLRCSVRLVQTTSGYHLWAERYDRQIEDVFALQDEIVRQVLVELQVRLTEGNSARIASRGTSNLEAWLLRVQGTAELNHVTPECNARARELFAAAHRADPNWARPLSALAGCDFFDARNSWSASRQESIEIGIEYAKRATEMDPIDPFGFVMLRLFNILLGNYDDALAFSKKAVSIAPNDTMALGHLATQFLWMNEVERAVEIFQRMVRSAPIIPTFHRRYYGLALQIIGDTKRAVDVLEELEQFDPKYLEGLAQLAAAYVSVGRIDAARETVRKIREQDPAYNSAKYLSTAIYFQVPERTAWLRAQLIKAGLP